MRFDYQLLLESLVAVDCIAGCPLKLLAGSSPDLRENNSNELPMQNK